MIYETFYFHRYHCTEAEFIQSKEEQGWIFISSTILSMNGIHNYSCNMTFKKTK